MLRDRFLAAWRTAVQVLFAATLAWLTHWGIRVSPSFSGWLELAAFSAGAGVWAAATHWLLAQTGNGPLARLLRLVGQVLTLGPAQVATYTAPGRGA